MADQEIPVKDSACAFISLKAAAAMIGCTRRFLETRIDDGEIKVFRPSKRFVRIRISELERFIEVYSFGGTSLG